jgi:TetR/AcrR family transcriptional regulator, mexJK operon transcriptional repressor
MNAPSRRVQNRLERRQRILDGALRVFSEAGFSGATMDDVAAAAGLSKPTLYQYFTSKDALFQAMMTHQRDRMMVVLDHPSPQGMVRDLHDFAWDYATAVMQPEMLSLARLIIGEVQRLPEIGRAYQASGPDRLLAGIMSYLTAQRDAGRLIFDDAELAAQDFWGLILSAPRTQALYRPDALPSRAALSRYVMNGLRVFLRAYSAHPTHDLEQLAALANARMTGDSR